jgi:hypothetical protein
LITKAAARAALLAKDASTSAQIARRRLACALVSDNLKGDFLTFDEVTQAGALDGADVNEHVLAAVVGLDEAETLLTIVELHGAVGHGDVLSLAGLAFGLVSRAARSSSARLSMFGEILNECPARCEAKRPDDPAKCRYHRIAVNGGRYKEFALPGRTPVPHARARPGLREALIFPIGRRNSPYCVDASTPLP